MELSFFYFGHLIIQLTKSESFYVKTAAAYPPMPVAKLNASVELYSLLRKLPVPLGRMGIFR